MVGVYIFKCLSLLCLHLSTPVNDKKNFVDKFYVFCLRKLVSAPRYISANKNYNNTPTIKLN